MLFFTFPIELFQFIAEDLSQCLPAPTAATGAIPKRGGRGQQILQMLDDSKTKQILRTAESLASIVSAPSSIHIKSPCDTPSIRPSPAASVNNIEILMGFHPLQMMLLTQSYDGLQACIYKDFTCIHKYLWNSNSYFHQHLVKKVCKYKQTY